MSSRVDLRVVEDIQDLPEQEPIYVSNVGWLTFMGHFNDKDTRQVIIY